eukprot:8214609-Alexandrium_andersonii.AAC.1
MHKEVGQVLASRSRPPLKPVAETLGIEAKGGDPSGGTCDLWCPSSAHQNVFTRSTNPEGKAAVG